MNSWKGLVDGTDVQTLAGHLRSARPEYRMVLFVASREALCPTAELISSWSPGAGEEFARQVRCGEICLGRIDVPQDADEVFRTSTAVCVNLQRVPADTRCEVLAVPPMFVAYAPDLDLTPDRERETMAQLVREEGLGASPVPRGSKLRI